MKYEELVKALRWCSVDEYVPCKGCPMDEETHGTGCFNIMHQRAAAAIEGLIKSVRIRDKILDELNHYIWKLEAGQPQWVSVEDELPPPNKTVLVCKIWGDVNGEPHKVITMDSFTISPSDSVIAWMPLPEPPQEVQDGSSR